MSAYPDTSYLCSIFRQQSKTHEALVYRSSLGYAIPYTSLLEFEFLQSLRLQVYLHTADAKKGFALREAERTQLLWEADKAAGLVKQVYYDAEAVNSLAQTFSRMHTTHSGHRSLDIIHVATAVHLGAKTFLTFDARQKVLAEAVGLNVPF